MIQHEDEIHRDTCLEVRSLINLLGTPVLFSPPIKYRATPHTQTKYIDKVAIEDCFESMGEEINTILQRLKYENSKRTRVKGNFPRR